MTDDQITGIFILSVYTVALLVVAIIHIRRYRRRSAVAASRSSLTTGTSYVVTDEDTGDIFIVTSHNQQGGITAGACWDDGAERTTGLRSSGDA